MVTILLAAYNGERYIGEQIESILAQTEKDWHLVIQDDCSSDRTVEIVQSYVAAYPEQIKLIQRNTPSGSAKSNFFSMLSYVDTEYWMTCDQDDVWLSYKLEMSMSMMRNIERNHPNIPLLIHTDLMVVDQYKTMVAQSMFRYQKLDKRRSSFANLLSQNIVTGCTALMNRTLLEQIKIIPAEALMHDWWFALIASAFGKVVFVNQPTVLYRQHNENSVGAKNERNAVYLMRKASKGRAIRNALINGCYQAEAFLRIYGNTLSDAEWQVCHQFASLYKMGKLQKIKTIYRFDFWKNGMIRRLGQLCFI